jgi:hypothetical protein
MVLCWRHYIHGIHGIDQLFFCCKTLQAILFFHLFGNGIIGIEKPDKVYIRELFPIVQMKFTQVPGAKNAYVQHVPKIGWDAEAAGPPALSSTQRQVFV